MHVWHVAAFTHRGRVRSANEDTIAVGNHVLTEDMTAPLTFTFTDEVHLMVADGMGGHAQGALASRTVIDHLIANADQLANDATCAQTIQKANDQLYDLMQTQRDASGMGSTLVGAALGATQLLGFNIGDSRLYLQTESDLVQLSCDDIPSFAALRSKSRSHAITQALGGSHFPTPIAPHISIDPPLSSSETLLLCSDGLTNMVADSAISDVLIAAESPYTAVHDLATRALQAGGHDNISLIVARRMDAETAN